MGDISLGIGCHDNWSRTAGESYEWVYDAVHQEKALFKVEFISPSFLDIGSVDVGKYIALLKSVLQNSRSA
jgi:hypothetical protein